VQLGNFNASAKTADYCNMARPSHSVPKGLRHQFHYGWRAGTAVVVKHYDLVILALVGILVNQISQEYVSEKKQLNAEREMGVEFREQA